MFLAQKHFQGAEGAHCAVMWCMNVLFVTQKESRMVPFRTSSARSRLPRVSSCFPPLGCPLATARLHSGPSGLEPVGRRTYFLWRVHRIVNTDHRCTDVQMYTVYLLRATGRARRFKNSIETSKRENSKLQYSRL